MSVAFDEVQRQLLLEKIAHHDAIMRINLTLQASTYKINELRSYRKCLVDCLYDFFFVGCFLILLLLCYVISMHVCDLSFFQAKENLKGEFNM